MFDMLGKTVDVGDTIVYARARGRNPVTCIGVVTEVIERTVQLKVKWTHGIYVAREDKIGGNFVILKSI